MKCLTKKIKTMGFKFKFNKDQFNEGVNNGLGYCAVALVSAIIITPILTPVKRALNRLMKNDEDD